MMGTEALDQKVIFKMTKSEVARLEDWCRAQSVPPKKAAVYRIALQQFLDAHKPAHHPTTTGHKKIAKR